MTRTKRMNILARGTAMALAALVSSCSSDLRRDDLDGRPCPCLPGWQKQTSPDYCICVRSNQIGSGGTTASTGVATGAESGQTSSDLPQGGGGGGDRTVAGGGGDRTVAGGGGDRTVAGGGAVGGANPGSTSGGARVCPARTEPSLSNPCSALCDTCSSAGVCQHYCMADNSCGANIFVCPPGLACRVVCSGVGRCRQLVVQCPSTYACTVEGSGRQSCQDLQVECSPDGPCSATCSGSAACKSSDIQCGQNSCSWSPCTGLMRPVNCADACYSDCICP